jgi:hypothetical protein
MQHPESNKVCQVVCLYNSMPKKYGHDHVQANYYTSSSWHKSIHSHKYGPIGFY